MGREAPLIAVIDALERQRALFWTGSVLVEFDNHWVPHGPVTMVLDADDMAVLRAYKEMAASDDHEADEDDFDEAISNLSALDQLGGLTSEEAEALAQLSLDRADEFADMTPQDTTGKCDEFASWYKGRARLFHQLAAEESRAQAEWNRQQDQKEKGEHNG